MQDNNKDGMLGMQGHGPVTDAAEVPRGQQNHE